MRICVESTLASSSLRKEEGFFWGRDKGLYFIGRKHGKQTFIVKYKPEYCKDCLRQLGKWASDPSLPFTWYDASVLSYKIKKMEI